MHLEGEIPTCFLDVNPDDIAPATKLDEEFVIDKSSYQENWCVAWAPDSSYVAWSQGGGIVFLLPWDLEKGRLLKRPVRDKSYDNLGQIDDLDLNNLPRITVDDNIEDEKHENNKNLRKRFRIDCMDYVWSMAFGNGVTRSTINVHRRFTFKSDLILATGLQGGKIKLWNVYSGNLLMELLDHKNIVHGLSFKSDGSLGLVSCSSDSTIKFWDLNHDGNMYKTLRFKENVLVFSCKWSPTCEQVAAVGMNKCAYVWNTNNFSQPRKLVGHLHNVINCDYSPDGAILATASFDTRVILWDPYTGDQIKVLGHMFPSPRPIYAGGANEHYVRCVSFCREGNQMVTVADDGYIRFWDLDSVWFNPKCIAKSDKMLTCAYSSASHVAAAGRRDGRIEFYLPTQMKMPSLQHLCRVKIRQHVQETQKVDLLYYPCRLKEYLKYKLL